jgi:glutamine synthetase
MDNKELLKRVREDKVSFISYQFTDINGVVKSLDGPVGRLEEVLDGGIWFDGSSVEGLARIQESDMHLRVDPDTYTILPWSDPEYRRARVLCEIYRPNGQPFEGDPRGRLKAALKKVKEERGWTYNIGPEPEFYLFLRNGPEKTHPVPYDVGSYFDFSANDQAVNIRTEIISSLHMMGLKVEVGHHEVGLGQHEIDFQFDDALKTADNVQTFKSTVKAVAGRHGVIASFMPKPIYGAAGSGMHCHQSVYDEDGNNLFYDKTDPMHLSELAKQFIAGQLKHAKALSAVLAPTINSYKRLVPGYEAPVYIAWAQVNRSALIRVPQVNNGNTKAVRIELRCPDPSANPYLAFTSMLAAALTAVDDRSVTCPAPVNNINLYELTEKEREQAMVSALPGSLEDALNEFKANALMKDALGDSLYETFVTSREAEIKEYHTRVTDWEVVRYLETI